MYGVYCIIEQKFCQPEGKLGQIYKIFVEGFFLCQCYVILKRVKALKLFEKAVKHMSEKESISNGKHRKNPMRTYTVSICTVRSTLTLTMIFFICLRIFIKPNILFSSLKIIPVRSHKKRSILRKNTFMKKP